VSKCTCIFYGDPDGIKDKIITVRAVSATTVAEVKQNTEKLNLYFWFISSEHLIIHREIIIIFFGKNKYKNYGNGWRIRGTVISKCCSTYCWRKNVLSN